MTVTAEQLRQIQDAAVTTATPVSELLRRCQVFAARAGVTELEDWVHHELNGYPEGVELPGYRILSGIARGHFSGPFGSGVRNAILPAANLPEEYRDWARRAYIRQPVAAIEAAADGANENSLVVMWPGNLVAHVQELFIEHMVLVQGWLSLDRSQFVSIIESVRNRILSFAINAEQFVEANEDLSEPKISGGLTNVFHTHVYGSVGNLAQGSSSVAQTTEVTAGNLDALLTSLRAVGVSPEDVEELRVSIETDASPADGKLGKGVAGWIGKVISGAATGAKDVATEVAVTVIPKLIQRYYGLE